MATKKKTTKKTAKAKVPTKTQVTTPKKKAPKKAVKKTVAKKAAAQKPAAKKSASNVSPISAEDRYKMIEQAAYFLAERHHFQADPAAIWVQAEKEVDARIAGLVRR